MSYHLRRWRDFRELTVTQLVRKFPIFYHYHIHTSPPEYHCIQSNPSHPYLQYVQQNSFNLTSDNSGILTIRYLRRVVPRPEVFLFTIKSFINKTGSCHIHVPKRPQRVSVHQQLWYRLTPCLVRHELFQLWRLQKTQIRTLMTRNQQR